MLWRSPSSDTDPPPPTPGGESSAMAARWARRPPHQGRNVGPPHWPPPGGRDGSDQTCRPSRPTDGENRGRDLVCAPTRWHAAEAPSPRQPARLAVGTSLANRQGEQQQTQQQDKAENAECPSRNRQFPLHFGLEQRQSQRHDGSLAAVPPGGTTTVAACVISPSLIRCMRSFVRRRISRSVCETVRVSLSAEPVRSPLIRPITLLRRSRVICGFFGPPAMNTSAARTHWRRPTVAPSISRSSTACISSSSPSETSSIPSATAQPKR